MPAGEDHQRDAHPAPSSNDTGCECTQLGQRQKYTACGHQTTSQRQDDISDAENIQPCRIYRFWVFSNRAQVKPKRGSEEEPPAQWHHDQKREVRQ
jgi:hypothetical protein